MSNELKERWETEDGKDRLQRVVEAFERYDKNWSDILVGFPKVKEVKNGRDLRCAKLSGQNLQNADLRKADLSGAFLHMATFSCADIRSAKFHQAKFGGDFIAFGHGSIAHNVDFSAVRYNRRTSFLGVDISRNNWAANPLLKRHIEDEQWLDSWRKKNWFNKYILYTVWLMTCDCGRSFLIWAIWSLVFAIGFGFVFIKFGNSINLTAFEGKTLVDAHWFTPFYYSIVTFTTLGFGDIVPQSNNGIVQFLVTLEVVLGYIMLGGLISILANKIARRA